MTLRRDDLLGARDLAAVNSWIFDHHNCHERGTIVVPESYWDRADRGAREILINIARIEGWRYRIEPLLASPALELAAAPPDVTPPA